MALCGQIGELRQVLQSISINASETRCCVAALMERAPPCHAPTDVGCKACLSAAAAPAVSSSVPGPQTRALQQSRCVTDVGAVDVAATVFARSCSAELPTLLTSSARVIGKSAGCTVQQAPDSEGQRSPESWDQSSAASAEADLGNAPGSSAHGADAIAQNDSCLSEAQDVVGELVDPRVVYGLLEMRHATEDVPGYYWRGSVTSTGPSLSGSESRDASESCDMRPHAVRLRATGLSRGLGLERPSSYPQLHRRWRQDTGRTILSSRSDTHGSHERLQPRLAASSDDTSSRRSPDLRRDRLRASLVSLAMTVGSVDEGEDLGLLMDAEQDMLQEGLGGQLYLSVGRAGKWHWSTSRDFHVEEVSGGTLLQRIYGHVSSIPVVSAASVGKAWFDFVACMFVGIEMVAVPYSVAVDWAPPLWWTWGLVSYFSLDILLNMNTARYTASGRHVTKQPAVFWGYVFSRWCCLDLATTIPWNLVVAWLLSDETTGGGSARILRVARISRVARLVRILRMAKAKHIVAKFRQMYAGWAEHIWALWRGGRLVFYFIMGTHWVACFWVFLGRSGLPDDGELEPYALDACSEGGPCERGVLGSSWVVRYGVHGDRATAWQQYVVALNWAAAAVTGSSVDLQPGTQHERVFVFIVNVAAFLLCALLLASIVAVVTQVQEENKVFAENMSSVQVFMVRKAIPVALQMKVKQYLQYQRQVTKYQLNPRIGGVINSLSPFLRMKLMLSVFRQTLEHHPFFEAMTSVMLAGVCSRAESVVFAPGDAVVQRGAVADCMHFVVAGKLQVMGEESQQGGPEGVCFLEPPNYFGDLSLFKPMQRPRTIISLEYSELLVLYKASMIEICSEIPSFETYYRQTVDKLARGDLLGARLLCPRCRSMGHTAKRCPRRAARLDRGGSVVERLRRRRSVPSLLPDSVRRELVRL
mmetsp:Transcript_83732/g.191101  ORF Transcript_83732/g.191101 Transcript_83732/m.191101 type:complete len:929 (+) Transcript_83732:95-2881(+)